nr:hypothetical protein [Tanacetum cinerariifolium]
NRESARDVYSRNRIIAIKKLTIIEWHNYKHLEWIIVRRDDDKLYTFKKGDYNRLRLQDIKDMLLFLVQGKLTNLNIEERLALGVSLRMFTRRIVIQRRVEDLQLGVERYKKKLNLTKPDTYRSDLKRKTPCTTFSNHIGFIYQNQDKKNILMRMDELHKFSDGTLNDVRSALDDTLKRIRMKVLRIFLVILSEDQSDTQVITLKIEILLEPTSNKLMVGDLCDSMRIKLVTTRKKQWYRGRLYVSGHQDIFDMVGIDLFTVVALNMMVVKLGYTSESEPLFYYYLRPLTSQDEGLYALAYEEDARCLATLFRSFKLIDVYIEHGVMDLDCYIRPTRFRGIIEYISDESGSIATNRTKKILLLTWHESSELTKEPVNLALCHNVIQVYILSFEEIELDGKAGFADVTRSSVESSGLSNDESFRVDDLDLNLNEPVNLNVSQIETQSELHIFKEPDVDRTQEPIVAYVSTQKPIVAEVSTQEDESALNDGRFFYDNEGIDTAYETKYDVQSSEDADDVIEGEDVDVINPYGFNSNPGNDDETNDYKRRMLAELSREMKVKAVQDQLQYESKVQISMSKDFRAKAKAKREIRVKKNTDPSSPTREFQRIYICLGKVKLGFRACRGDMLSIDSAFMKGPFPGQVLADVGLYSNNGIYPLAYALVEAESKSSWCWFLQCLSDDIDGQYGQAYKDLLWRAASATSVKEFEKYRAKFDLMLNNISEVYNGKIVGGRDKPMITLLEYIREYCRKRILNVQSVIEKYSGPLTPTSARIMESIKKEAHLTKVQWNGANIVVL